VKRTGYSWAVLSYVAAKERFRWLQRAMAVKKIGGSGIATWQRCSRKT